MEKILNILVVEKKKVFYEHVLQAVTMLFGQAREPLPRIVKANSIELALDLCQAEDGEDYTIERPRDVAPPYDCSKVSLLVVGEFNEVLFSSLVSNFKQFGFDGQVIYLIDDDVGGEESMRLTAAGATIVLCRPTVDDIKNVLEKVFYPQPVAVP